MCFYIICSIHMRATQLSQCTFCDPSVRLQEQRKEWHFSQALTAPGCPLLLKDRSSALPEIPSFGEQTKGGPAHPDPWVSHADSVTWPNFQKLQLEVIWAPFTSSIPSSVFLVASLKLLPIAEVMDVVLQPLGSAVQGSLVCSLHVNASWK